jgi:hypothetical protein
VHIVATPGTPSDWAVFTPAATTPGSELSVPHAPHGESPIEREDGAATPSSVCISNENANQAIAETMLQCGAFIQMWTRPQLPTEPIAMSARYVEALKLVVAAQNGKSLQLVNGSTEFGLHVLRLGCPDDYFQLEEDLRRALIKAEHLLRKALLLTCKGSQHQAATRWHPLVRAICATVCGLCLHSRSALGSIKRSYPDGQDVS